MLSGCIATAYTVHCYGVGRFHYIVNMTVFTCLNTLKKKKHLSALIDKIIVSLFYTGYAFEIIIGTVVRTRGKSLQKCRRRRRGVVVVVVAAVVVVVVLVAAAKNLF